MRVPFIKMHGLGNDFIVLDGRAAALPEITGSLARALADRKTGIGCDQLIVLAPSARLDAKMRIFNADGGEVEACGNASRAVGLLLGAAATIETLGGDLAVRPDPAGVAVDMGEPRFDWQAIPLAYPLDTLTMPVGWEDLDAPAAVNVGNPHVIFFVPDVQAVDLARLGPLIETRSAVPGPRQRQRGDSHQPRTRIRLASLGTRRGRDPRVRHGCLCHGSRGDAARAGRSQRFSRAPRRPNDD